MVTLTQQELDRAVRDVLKRSVSDPAFRRAALQNGNASLTSITGKSAPAGLIIRFADNAKPNFRTIVLPDPIVDVEHLSEADLESVAGGVKDECGTSCGGLSCLST